MLEDYISWQPNSVVNQKRKPTVISVTTFAPKMTFEGMSTNSEIDDDKNFNIEKVEDELGDYFSQGDMDKKVQDI